jgi:hypothetical protein
MSGLLDRIFPRRDASSEPAEDDARLTGPRPPAGREGESAAAGEGGAAATGETSVLPAEGALAGRPAPTGETSVLPAERGPTAATGPAPGPAAPGPAPQEPAAQGPVAHGATAQGSVAQGPAAGGQPGAAAAAAEPSSAAAANIPEAPSASQRPRLRRRLRYLRKQRELLLRDLGGFVFDTRRFGRAREDLVEAKMRRLAAVDGELRALEQALEDRRAIHELREPGVGGICDRCGAFFPSTARFCSDCGAPVSARGAPAAAPAPAAPAAPPAAAPAPAAPAAPAAPPAAAPAPQPDPASSAGSSLWSGCADAAQSTPGSGTPAVARPASEPAGQSPQPPATAAANGGDEAERPGELQRPQDDSTTPPSLSSGDPLQSR